MFLGAEQFLPEVGRCNPDLVVLDLALGNTDAVEIIRQLHALKFAGKVLLVSGRDEGTLSEIEAIGGAHGLCMLPSLRKPFKIGHIKERLQSSPTPYVARSAARGEPLDAPRGQPRLQLDEALRRNWLELWYQPKIDLGSLSICGAEALIRARIPITASSVRRSCCRRAGTSLQTIVVLCTAPCDGGLGRFRQQGLSAGVIHQCAGVDPECVRISSSSCAGWCPAI